VNDTYDLFAIRYAHHDRTASHNFLGGDPHDGPMPLDFFVWAIVGNKQSFVLDTGFDATSAAKRQRTLLRPVGEGLRMIGIDPDGVADVIISHMHYDHSGNHRLFPQARYHLQDAEMNYCRPLHVSPGAAHSVRGRRRDRHGGKGFRRPRHVP
jgi:glyoxylase-like metal-dependent hydrolase (beta-lactamase superfamily II)